MVRLIPNLITASRGAAGLAIAWLLVAHRANGLAFALLVTAVLTDLVDGWLARRFDTTGGIGEWLDPLSDKILTAAVWLSLWWIGWAPPWLVAVLLIRDLAVAVGYSAAYRQGLSWRTSRVGQVMVSFEGVALAVLVFHGPWLGIHWPTVGVGLGTITLALSAGSALEYVAVGPQPPEVASE